MGVDEAGMTLRYASNVPPHMQQTHQDCDLVLGLHTQMEAQSKVPWEMRKQHTAFVTVA